MQRLVVAGTGTGVGKTYFTSRLRTCHPDAIALKPIESGYDPARSDAWTIEGPGSWVEPLFHFPAPLAPHLVARRAGEQIRLEAVAPWVVEHATRRAATLAIVETAGGLFTPLDDDGRNNLDLVAALEPCVWVLVAANRLGVLHQVLSTTAAARARHRPPDLVVLTGELPDESGPDNRAELQRMLPSVPVHELPRGATLGDQLQLAVRLAISARG